jgi:DnaJ family protein A protein 5
MESYLKSQNFGHENTELDYVKNFYAYWDNFSTCKTFTWADEYKAQKEDDRFIKRATDKENKKIRVKAKQAYLHTVQSLVDFVRKRDPRWKSLQLHQVKIAQKKEEERKAKEAQKKEDKKVALAKSREEEQLRFAEIDRYRHDQELADKKNRKKSSFDENEFECQICSKVFKNDNTFKNHEKSKLHLKK